jgi:lon-related putative ATP-dependent protease
MKNDNGHRPLPAEQLYHGCNLEALAFKTTAELEPLPDILGQERAQEAIEFGVGMPFEGFNLYVMGSTGLGRHALIENTLRKQAADSPPPVDWCYVANFHNPNSPGVLEVPPGVGTQLRLHMQQLIDDLLSAIPAAFQSDEYLRRSQEIKDDFKHREDQAAMEIGKKAEEKGIVLLRGPTGFTLTPQRDGEPLSPTEFEKLPEKEQRRLGKSLDEMKEALRKTMELVPDWQRELRQRFRKLDQETIELTVSGYIAELERQYQPFDKVVAYLGEVRQDIIENVDMFRQAGDPEEPVLSSQIPEFVRYEVNVLVDNSDTEGAPVIYEDNPTHHNLLGRVEHFARMGTLSTNFTLIKPGALHRANGGYLILDVEKILSNPFAWEGLKRAIKAKKVHIESLEHQLSLVSTISLEPQPIPLKLKVVLVGSRLLFYLLKFYDPEFSLLFKVTADFAEELSRAENNEPLYARLIAMLQRREGLRDIDRDGVARIVEHGVHQARDGLKLSLHMEGLLNLLQEADYMAGKTDSPIVSASHVQDAIDAQIHRVNQLQEQLQEEILNGTINIETSGSQLARINGLSIIHLGDYLFGTPTRISATARIGSGEFIDIERETEQGGPIHSKGVLILTSYLAQRYARHQPLSASASLVFEQTYGEVEGDSASAAELCALLSALGSIPLKQSLAITGAVNQHGQIQAIGGVCQKIEGFFDICNARGLTGEQGVIIPAANVKDLMLRQDVVEAAENGRFSIFAMDHIEPAMELLTGLEAGVADANGVFPEHSINYRVQLQLAEWTALRQQYANKAPEEH